MGGLLMPGGLMGGNGSHMPGGFPNPNDPNGLASMMMWPSLYQYQAAFQQQQQQQQHMQQHQQQQLHPSFQHMPPGFFPPGMPGVPPEGSAGAWGAGGYGLEGGGAQSEEGKTGAAAAGGGEASATAAASTTTGDGESAEAHANDQQQGSFPPSLMPSASDDPKEASAWSMPPAGTLLPPPMGLLPLPGSNVGGTDGEQGAAKRMKGNSAAEELEHVSHPWAFEHPVHTRLPRHLSGVLVSFLLPRASFVVIFDFTLFSSVLILLPCLFNY
jgi:hypothetical protein